MRGYWLPPGYKKLSAYDGFFIKSDAVFLSDNPTKDWDCFLHKIKSAFLSTFTEFKVIQQWRTVADNQNIYVILDNGAVMLITDDADGYIAVYLISTDKKTPDITPFRTALQHILCKYYPQSVYKRVSYRELKKISGDENGK